MIPSQFESWLEIEYVVLFTSQILGNSLVQDSTE